MERTWDSIDTGDLPDTLRVQALTEILRITLPPMLTAHPRAEALRNDLRLQLARWQAEDTPVSRFQAQVLLGLLQSSGDTRA